MTSTIKVDDIQAADGGNLINQCGTTITLGASGDTINLASGASQTGFGRTGTVDWDTTVVTSTPTTGVNGVGYFIDSSGGAKTINLPASPTAGDIMAVSDYAQTAATNNITVGRNGSNIQGSASDLVISNGGVALTLVYIDGTKGWIVVNSGDESDKEPNPEFIVATGGNATITSGDFKTHIFTSPGTFTVSCVGNPAGSTQVDYVVVAGGGGAGTGCAGGGGGAGGFRESHDDCVSGSYTASPLATPASITVTAQGYPIAVGGGGPGAPGPGGANSGCAGSVSSALGISSAGGSFGGAPGGNEPGGNGGSGGGGGHFGGTGGSGNTPPVSPPQGNNGAPANSPGGSGPGDTGGGGGGAGGAALSNPGTPVQGGPGVTTQMVTATYGVSTPTPGRGFASGGGGSTRCRGDGATPNQGAPNPNSPPNGGLFGGGASGGFGPYPAPQPQTTGGDGTANTGGGGGGASRFNPGSNLGNGGNGGSGIVMIRYKFQ
jgi:hypothetical protein